MLSAAWLLTAGLPAQAIQFTLSGNERINQSGSPLPGTTYNTGPGGVDYDAVGSADPHPGVVVVTGTVPSLNYHTTSAPTTNVNFNFTPDLTFTMEAALQAVTLTTLSPTQVRLQIDFAGTPNGQPDLVVVDPSDSTQVLRALLVAGTLSGSPVPALRATGVFNPNSVPTNLTMSFVGFFKADPTSPYASLFAESAAASIGFEIGQVLNWNIGDGDTGFDFNDIVAAYQNTNVLISHVAEANGTVRGISGSTFVPVPEPTTLLMLGSGLVGLAWVGRSRNRTDEGSSRAS